MTENNFGPQRKIYLSSVFSTKQDSNHSLATESLDMILSNERKPNALIRLRESAGWSAPLLFVSQEEKYTDVILVLSVNVSGCSIQIHTYENLWKISQVCKQRIYSIPLSKHRNLSC